MDKIAEIRADMDAARERFEDNVLDHIWKRHGECELYYGAHSYMQTAQDRFDAMHSELEREQGVREDAQRQLRAMRAEVEALRKGMTPRGTDMIVPEALLDEINAVSAGYMVDALRYRCLRSSLYLRNVDVGEATLCLLVTGACPSVDEFDAAIDAAMQGGA